MGFHAELQLLLEARGLSRSVASIQAGLSETAVGFYLNTRGYPHPRQLEKLIRGLAVPEETGARWREEDAAVLTDRSKRAHAASAPERVPRVALTCRSCGILKRVRSTKAVGLRTYEPSGSTFLCRRCWEKEQPSKRVSREVRVCANPQCAQAFECRSTSRQRFHDIDCKYAARRALQPPTEPFNRFVYDRWRESGLSVRGFAERYELREKMLYSTLLGKHPFESTFEAVRAALGEDVPPVETETARRRAFGRYAVEIGWVPPVLSQGWLENRRKSAATKRARPWKPSTEQIARSIATKRATGALERATAHFVRRSRLKQTRVVASLRLCLLRRPLATGEDLAALQLRVCRRYGVRRSLVADWWRPLLKDKGLRLPTGRPQLDQHIAEIRLREIAIARANWLRRGSPRAGYWADAQRRIAQIEGPDAPLTSETVRNWSFRWTALDGAGDR